MKLAAMSGPASGPTRVGLSRQVTRPRLVFLGILLIVAVLSFLYLRLISELATSAYDLAQLEQEQQAWQIRNDELRLQVSQLSTLDRVARLAADRLQMGPPARTAYVTAPDTASPAVKPDSPTIALDRSIQKP